MSIPEVCSLSNPLCAENFRTTVAIAMEAVERDDEPVFDRAIDVLEPLLASGNGSSLEVYYTPRQYELSAAILRCGLCRRCVEVVQEPY